MKKFKILCEENNLDFKKEIFKNILLILLGIIACILICYFVKNTFGYLYGILAIVVAIVYIFFKYNKLRTKANLDHINEYISLFTYLRIYLKNNMTVYQSLNNLLEYASKWMKDQLLTLINEIDNDKSVTPFITFSKKFTNDDILVIMITIYHMSDEGVNNEYLTNFSNQFDKLQEIQNENIILNYKSKIDSKNLFALIGAGIFTFGLMLGVINLLGVISNGI